MGEPENDPGESGDLDHEVETVPTAPFHNQLGEFPGWPTTPLCIRGSSSPRATIGCSMMLPDRV